MKLHAETGFSVWKLEKTEYPMSNKEYPMSKGGIDVTPFCFKKIGFLPSLLGIRYWIFNIRFLCPLGSRTAHGNEKKFLVFDQTYSTAVGGGAVF
jgi:hypothetical protein